MASNPLTPRFLFFSTSAPGPSQDFYLPNHAIDDLVREYEKQGVIPCSSRIDRTLIAQDRSSLGFWECWKYPAFAFTRASNLTVDILSHHIWGPRRKSWGIQMTIMTSLMRDVSRHSALADVNTLRRAMAVTGLVPLPSDALATPVSFRVKRRGLKGFLARLDAQETGRRELSGEWIMGKHMWQRMQARYRARRASRSAEGRSAEGQSAPDRSNRVILYIHGGAYCSSSAASQRIITIPLSKYTNCRVFAIDYRLSPETRFPGPLYDVAATYFRLTDDLKLPPQNIIVAGDSAGGGLALALLLYLRDNNYPLPGGAILFSPWVDLTLSAPSWESNAPFDIIPLPGPDAHLHPVVMYLGEGLASYVLHPYASPLFGNFSGLPPLLIQTGDAEVLHDENIALAVKAARAGVKVRCEAYEDAVHVFQAFPFLPAASKAFASCRDFVFRDLPTPGLRTTAEQHLEEEAVTKSSHVLRGDGTEVADAEPSRAISAVDSSAGSDPEAFEAARMGDRSGYKKYLLREESSELPTPVDDLPSWIRSGSARPAERPGGQDDENPTPYHPPLRRVMSAVSLVMDTSTAYCSSRPETRKSEANLPGSIPRTSSVTALGDRGSRRSPSPALLMNMGKGPSSFAPLVGTWSSLAPAGCRSTSKAHK